MFISGFVIWFQLTQRQLFEVIGYAHKIPFRKAFLLLNYSCYIPYRVNCNLLIVSFFGFVFQMPRLTFVVNMEQRGHIWLWN